MLVGLAAFIAQVRGDITRVKGMTQITRQSGLSRASLYKALTGYRSPSFDAILKTVSVLGFKYSAYVKAGPIIEEEAQVA